MARQRRATAETAEPETVPANDSTVQAVAEMDVFDQAIAAQQAVSEPANETPANGHAAAVKQRRAVEHSKIAVPAGDLTVHLLDKGDNEAGIGIRVTMPEGRKLTEEEKEIIRSNVKGEENGYPSGFAWNGQMGMWHKDIGGDSAPARAVAIRLDAESRVNRIADELRQHQADPVGFAEMVQQRREQAAQGAALPD